MKILTSKTPSSTAELSEVLQREYSRDYSFSFFGLGKEKSIIVRKSFFVGAQISRRGNEITIEALPPIMTIPGLSFLLELVGTSNILRSVYGASWKELEINMSAFLKRKYS
jgi:hypothetical protein